MQIIKDAEKFAMDFISKLEKTVKDIARTVGIDKVIANVLPAEKAQNC